MFTLPHVVTYKTSEGNNLAKSSIEVKFKVVSIRKKEVECNVLENALGIPLNESVMVDIEKIANEGTIVEEKKEMVSHPSHYAWLKDLCGVEPLDICRHLDFNCGSIIKYILRKGKKEMNLDERQQRIQDLKKAKVYLEDEIKMLENQKQSRYE